MWSLIHLDVSQLVNDGNLCNNIYNWQDFLRWSLRHIITSTIMSPDLTPFHSRIHISILNSSTVSFIVCPMIFGLRNLECSKYRFSFWYTCTDFISHQLKGRHCAVKRYVEWVYCQFISFRLELYKCLEKKWASNSNHNQ